MADCPHCEKSVLTYVMLDESGSEQRVCVHCDNPVGAALAWVGPGGLEQSGYYFGPPPEEGAKGCSSGCGRQEKLVGQTRVEPRNAVRRFLCVIPSEAEGPRILSPRANRIK
jgi:hypothetical protein